ncbi:MAG: sulfur carrier protein ThiS [Candidatus Thermoplasmatota archaeon]|jgi:thiamine biosynthesis protein ThiS|nr:sulfur carrier protein ThiS [Thermoplasmatales archaeon]
MTIEVNGRKIDWIENESVTKLLKRMKYTFPLVVVKINNEIVLRSDFKIKVIPDNSNIDVIHMISGG